MFFDMIKNEQARVLALFSTALIQAGGGEANKTVHRTRNILNKTVHRTRNILNKTVHRTRNSTNCTKEKSRVYTVQQQ
jgi:hypothetical protein